MQNFEEFSIHSIKVQGGYANFKNFIIFSKDLIHLMLPYMPHARIDLK